MLLVALTGLVLLAVPLLTGDGPDRRATGVRDGPVLLTRGLPVHASTELSPATSANDDDYGTEWRSTDVPAWLAYDLSSVPVERRGRVLAAWSNTSYGYSTTYGPHYNNLGSYTIQVNDAPGGGDVPRSGWTTEVTVTGNTLHSRQHVLDLDGASWIRLDVTAADGSPQNDDVAVNVFDVYSLEDAGGDRASVPDSFVFYGDSITAFGMCPCPSEGVGALPELIQAARPGLWPVMENGGDPFTTSSDAVASILGSTGYLSLFPGSHVGLSYGMNDAAGDAGQELFHANMRQLVQAVLAAGKTPMIPTISYTGDAGRNAVIPSYNAKITQLYAEFPQIVRGPDLWTFFSGRRDLLAPGDIHPTAAGYAALRSQWATTLLSTVYADLPTTPAADSAPAPDPAEAGRPARLGQPDPRRHRTPVRLLGVNHSGQRVRLRRGDGRHGRPRRRQHLRAKALSVFEPADFDGNRAYLDAIKTWGSNTIRIGLNEACWLGINGVSPTWSGTPTRTASAASSTSPPRPASTSCSSCTGAPPPPSPPTAKPPCPAASTPPPSGPPSPRRSRPTPPSCSTCSTNPTPTTTPTPPPPGSAGATAAPPTTRPTPPAAPAPTGGTPTATPSTAARATPTPSPACRSSSPPSAAPAPPTSSCCPASSTPTASPRWRTHKPTDPANNLAASWHVYPFNTCNTPTCWNTTIAPVATTTPLITAEIGDHDCASTFAPTVMTWLDQHTASYLAWTWNTWGCGGLQLMTDYLTGTPTTYGTPIHDHLQRVTGR